MLRFSDRKVSWLLVAAICGVLAAASPLWAQFRLLAFSTQPIDSVDAKGNPTPTLTTDSAGKIFKDSTTGIVLQINRSAVANAFGQAKIFRNRGLTMFDPESYEPLTSTSDYTLVFERTIAFQGIQNPTGWGAVEVKVFDPALAPAPIP